jgi:ferric-dicitrate binding protein FerR (iron transport regulator)
MSKEIYNNTANEPEMDIRQKILKRVSQYRVPNAISKEHAFLLLKTKIENKESRVVPFSGAKNLKKIFWYLSAAASILLLFGIWHFVMNVPEINILAAKGEHINYQLPDGSIVALNAESEITYKKENFTKKRSLEMKGEAFFNIQKGGHFEIHTKFADIQILGTSFNVFARENSFKVSCITGKIRVESDNQSLTIIPGESVVLSNKTLTKFRDKNIQSIANWRNGEFYYENTPIENIFEEIKRQYNVNFVLPEMKTKLFTGSFTNNNLANTLDIVCIPMGLNYEIGNNGKILITEKP